MNERRLSSVPRPAIALLGVGLALQLCWHGLRPGPEAAARHLPPPPSIETLRLSSLGDPIVFAKLLMLWLQAFDNPPGISIPFRDLNYVRVRTWLGHILALDPRAQYPLLAASRVYALVPIPAKQRLMLDFVYREFLEDPNHRWRWLADAALTAKHRLHDLPLALKYSRAITRYATGPEVPYWARDMTALVLEDLGEYQSARVLIGGLLASGMITDPHELRFLKQKLAELKKKADEKSTGR